MRNVNLLQAELRCYEHGKIIIGNHCWFSLRTQIISCSRIIIGNFCIFTRDTNEHPIDPFIRSIKLYTRLKKELSPSGIWQ